MCAAVSSIKKYFFKLYKFYLLCLARDSQHFHHCCLSFSASRQLSINLMARQKQEKYEKTSINDGPWFGSMMFGNSALTGAGEPPEDFQISQLTSYVRKMLFARNYGLGSLFSILGRASGLFLLTKFMKGC